MSIKLFDYKTSQFMNQVTVLFADLTFICIHNFLFEQLNMILVRIMHRIDVKMLFYTKT